MKTHVQGLAKIAAAMANGGSLKGVKVLGEKGWKALHAEPTPGNLGMNLSEDVYFTQVFRFSVSAHFIIRGVLLSFARGSAMVSGMDTMVGLDMAEAFSNGTQSSKLGLPMFRHLWSFTACTTEKAAECRLVDHLDLTFQI